MDAGQTVCGDSSQIYLRKYGICDVSEAATSAGIRQQTVGLSSDPFLLLVCYFQMSPSWVSCE